MIVEGASNEVALGTDGANVNIADLLRLSCAGTIGLPAGGRTFENGLELCIDGGSREVVDIFGGGNNEEVDVGVGMIVEVVLGDGNRVGEADVVDKGS